MSTQTVILDENNNPPKDQVKIKLSADFDLSLAEKQQDSDFFFGVQNIIVCNI